MTITPPSPQSGEDLFLATKGSFQSNVSLGCARTATSEFKDQNSSVENEFKQSTVDTAFEF
jgi:hypothetical protein